MNTVCFLTGIDCAGWMGVSLRVKIMENELAGIIIHVSQKWLLAALLRKRNGMVGRVGEQNPHDL